MCMSLCKITTCERYYSSPRPSKYTTMKLNSYPVWIRVYVQARINTPLIPLIKAAIDNVSKCDIIKIKMRWNPSSDDAETY